MLSSRLFEISVSAVGVSPGGIEPPTAYETCCDTDLCGVPDQAYVSVLVSGVLTTRYGSAVGLFSISTASSQWCSPRGTARMWMVPSSWVIPPGPVAVELKRVHAPAA